MTDKDLNEDDFEFDDSCIYAVNLAKQFGEHLKAQGKKSFTFGELRAFDKARFEPALSAEDLELESQLPQYECTKRIRAAKIRRVDRGSPRSRLWINPVDMYNIDPSHQIASVDVDCHYMDKFKPVVGGYYIKNEDGSESYCSGEVLEPLFSVV
jgi:hypothetical protein